MARDESEDISFLQEMRDVTPLKQDKTPSRINHKPSLAQQLKREALEREARAQRNFLSSEHITPVPPRDPIGYKKDGVQQGVFKNLRLGKYAIDSVLHLHKVSVEKARSLVFETMHDAADLNIRVLLIKHGTNPDSKPFPGLMKSCISQWLPQLDQVLAFHTALPQHGGAGATYVLLKKSSEQRQANRELHRPK